MKPHRRDKFWMVTFRDEQPDSYYELPMYFALKREAIAYKEHLEKYADDFYGDIPLAVKVSDEPWESIEWPGSDGSQW